TIPAFCAKSERCPGATTWHYASRPGLPRSDYPGSRRHREPTLKELETAKRRHAYRLGHRQEEPADLVRIPNDLQGHSRFLSAPLICVICANLRFHSFRMREPPIAADGAD